MAKIKTQFRGGGTRLTNYVADVAGEVGGPAPITWAGEVSVTMTPTGGTGASVEYTYSNLRDVIAGTAVWQAWAAGVVTAKTSAVLPGTPTGVRVVNTTGATSVADFAVGL